MGLAKTAAMIGVGMVAGLLSGLLGVGGGVIIVPALVYFLGFEMHAAVGTSLAIIVPTAIASALTHYRQGNVRLDAFALIAVGSVLGSVAGARFAQVVPGDTLRKAFAVVMIFTAVRMLMGGSR